MTGLYEHCTDTLLYRVTSVSIAVIFSETELSNVFVARLMPLLQRLNSIQVLHCLAHLSATQTLQEEYQFSFDGSVYEMSISYLF